MKVAVIGAGSWGSAVAWLLAGNGYDVCIWARNEQVVETINTEHFNPQYLCEVHFPHSVTATSSIPEAVESASCVVMVTPSAIVRTIADQLVPVWDNDAPVIILSKGVEGQTGLLMVDILEEIVGNRSRLAVLSGPNHAEEVSRGLPSATVIASDSLATARFFQEVFSAPLFRVYTSSDVIGVELCAAAKNIIAIAVGVAAGVGYGDNTAALIMTRGLAEISRLVAASGGDPLTCMGLAGMGDLVATCTSQYSRNRRFGELVARGGTLNDFTAETHMVVEGATACRTVTDLAARLGVDMPLAKTVRSVVWDGCSVEDMTDALIERPQREEFYGLS